MRGLFLFAVGTLTGLAIHVAVAQSQTPGNLSVNHVGINVADMEEALEYYTQVMGFPEAFRLLDDAGALDLVYVQVSRDTFVELRPVNEGRPAGISHIGLYTDDIEGAAATLRGRGANASEPRLSGSGAKSILSFISDPYGNRMELNELPPDALTRLAMERWQ